MSGLLRRLTRRRPATADETGPAAPASSEPAGAPAETPVEPGGDQPVPAPEAATAVPAPAADEQATQVIPATGEQTVAIPAVATVRDLPAGVDPSEYADAPEASAPRGKVRRRLRYLRRMRDLLLRDLGGFTFEIRRTAGGTADETQRRLLESKMKRIEALDSEVRGLEARLGEPHTGAVLREPGIGGACPECGELYASDAHYCARCGTPLDAKARARRDAAVAAAVQQTTGSHQVAEPAPASLLWAAGPRPAAKPEETAPEEEPQSELTSQWLTLPPRPETAEEEPPAAAESEAAAAPAPAAETETAAAAEPEPVEEPASKPSAEAAPETHDAAPEEPQGEPPAETQGESPAETRDAAAETRDETKETRDAAADTRDETAETRDEADEPTYEPAPNGRRQGDVPDPLTSQRDQAS
jgi:hypothetical protein